MKQFPERYEVFQSLFLWNLPSDISYWKIYRPKCKVSILVFVELALGRERCYGRIWELLVSILVFVELALGRGSTFVITDSRRVSILVFVELALGP